VDVVKKNTSIATLFKKNELYNEGATDPSEIGMTELWVPSLFNVSRKALFEILTKHDIAPAACTHIRGQEQIFGSRVTKSTDGRIKAFGK
jgi:hypothetical protein